MTITITKTFTAYTLDELRDLHPAGYERAIDEARDFRWEVGVVDDAVSEGFTEWLYDNAPGLRVSEWEGDEPRLAGSLALTDEERTARVLAGLPDVPALTIRETPDRNWMGGYWAGRVETDEIWGYYDDPESAEWEDEDVALRPVLARLARLEHRAAVEYAYLLDEAQSVEAVRDWLRDCDSLFTADGERVEEVAR